MSTNSRWPGVRFYPWERKNHTESALGLRLLIVGESHYKKNKSLAVEKLSEDFTRDEFIPNCCETYRFLSRINSLFDYSGSAPCPSGTR